MVFLSCVSHAFASVHCCIVLGKGQTSSLSSVMFNFVFVTFSSGILGQVWYLNVSIPDLCHLSYFVFGGTKYPISLEVSRQVSLIIWQISPYSVTLNIQYP